MSLVQYDSERFVIACVVSRPQNMATAISLGLHARHFATDAHRTVFEVAHELFRSDTLSSSNVVRSELISRNQWASAGDDTGWADLLGNYGWEESELPYHVRRVSHSYRLREERRAMEEALADLEAEGSLDDKQRAVDEAATRLLELSAEEGSTVATAAGMARDFEEEFESETAKQVYSPTGFISLDMKIGGLPIGRVATVAAFVSQGKSAFTDQIMLNHGRRWAKQGKNLQAIKFSPEVPNQDSRRRIVSNLSEIQADRIEGHIQGDARLIDTDRDKVRRAYAQLKTLPLTWDEKSSPSTAYMRARLLAEHARKPVGLAVFDYLEMTGEEHDTKRIKLEKAMIGCHEIARDMGIPFIVVAQINRAGHGRPDGVPHLSDLAETSMIEKVSSLVVMLHHPHTHWSQTDRTGEEPELPSYNVLVRKNTRGPLGAISTINWRKECLRFYDERDPEERTSRPAVSHYYDD